MRIQETQAELPRGSIPRSLEIVLRAEAVEMAQAGDRCDFTGTLIVVPDVSQLRTPGMDVNVASHLLLWRRGSQKHPRLKYSSHPYLLPCVSLCLAVCL